jgi:hypothetical protein
LPQARKQGGSVETNYLATGAETGHLGREETILPQARERGHLGKNERCVMKTKV